MSAHRHCYKAIARSIAARPTTAPWMATIKGVTSPSSSLSAAATVRVRHFHTRHTHTWEQQQQQQAEEQEEEEPEYVRKERAYLDRLPFTLQDARDSVGSMRKLLEDESSEYVRQLSEIGAREQPTREALFDKLLATLGVLSAVRRQVMAPYQQGPALRLEHTPQVRLQSQEDTTKQLEKKFRYLIGQHARKDDDLRGDMWDMYAHVAKRVFGFELKKAEDFLSDDRAIAVYIGASRKAAEEMGSPEMLEKLLVEYGADAMRDPQKKKEIGDKIYAPLLFQREWEQLEIEEGVQVEMQKAEKERKKQERQQEEQMKELQRMLTGNQAEEQEGKAEEEEEEEKKDGEEEEEEEDSIEPVQLATMEGFINYKFIVAESLFRGRMRTVEPEDEQEKQG